MLLRGRQRVPGSQPGAAQNTVCTFEKTYPTRGTGKICTIYGL
jgi:hypothetical protein